jgi:hypothetical protein
MSIYRVKASPEKLVDQAGSTARTYLFDAIKYIDEFLGEGFAKKHPELIGQFMLTAAIDFHAASVQISGQSVGDALEAIRGLGTIDDVSDALESIAGAQAGIAGAIAQAGNQVEAVASAVGELAEATKTA